MDGETNNQRNPVKLIVAAIVGAYFLWVVVRPREWRLLDGVNLLVHEAGHPLFGVFGEFISIAGGSLIQVIIPIVFVIYFFREGQRFSAALTLNWVGHNLINVSIYAGDAVAMQLPLVGNGDRIHDWNYLLTELQLLGAAGSISLALQAAGSLTIIFAICLAIKFALDKEEPATDL
jgi:hypothetical protein